MKLKLDSVALKKVILLFWMLYFLIVVISNITDGLKNISLLSEDFAFASGNFGLMEQVVAIYHTPQWMVVIMYLGVIAWEGLAAGAFFQAFRAYQKDQTDRIAIYRAFVIAFSLWAAFILMDELFVAFAVADLERTHQILMITQLLTLFAIESLPDGEES